MVFDNNFIVIILCTLVIVLGVYVFVKKGYLAFLGGQRRDENIEQSDGSQYTQINIKGKTYKLERADTPQKRTVGLMNREHMDEDKGMIFIFDNSGFHSFWMRNTYIPLDIIWVNSAGKVVHIVENAQPCKNIIGAICSTMVPSGMAKYVIELNAGEVEKLKLETNEIIEISI